MTTLNKTVERVTQRIAKRSERSRKQYLSRVAADRNTGPARGRLGCTNLAHSYAAVPDDAKDRLRLTKKRSNVAIVSAYNDMLSAHQPLKNYPDILKTEVYGAGGVAQFAGGVPAMCDGVTQGQAGMDLSLFSRDVIAMSTAVALSHSVFDAGLYLGVCDKIVPGLLIGALSFGHLPALFVPAGPMTSGVSNSEKAKTRQLFAEGKVDRHTLLLSEEGSYHGPGTCTFYGTANSNQMLMEIMGLHVPGSAFVNPGTPLREALTRAAGSLITGLADNGGSPVAEIVSDRTIVNAIVGLLATGGSTNHTIHLIAIARAAGLVVNWDDFSELSEVVPLLARIYPNGGADVNHFHAAGGLALVIRQLLDAGLLHEDVLTVAGRGLRRYCQEPWLNNGQLEWRDAPAESLDKAIVASIAEPFDPEGGIRLLRGNLGRGVIKTSAVPAGNRVITAPARVFDSQDAVLQAFSDGQLDEDVVVVVLYQGPRSNGMPELHKLSPPLGALQDRGRRVALVTDGRMSGASGKFPAAIHLSPECLQGGNLARVRDGDIIVVDCVQGVLEVKVDDATLAAREPRMPDLTGNRHGTGRNLFGVFRQAATSAEHGASCTEVESESAAWSDSPQQHKVNS